MSEQEFEKTVEQFCDGYCKFPYICKDEEQLHTMCDSCPIVKLTETLEQKSGEWVPQKGKPEAVCSRCGRAVAYQIKDGKWEFENFCPRCGAEMVGNANGGQDG